jgi:hypothetical protein
MARLLDFSQILDQAHSTDFRTDQNRSESSLKIEVHRSRSAQRSSETLVQSLTSRAERTSRHHEERTQ